MTRRNTALAQIATKIKAVEEKSIQNVVEIGKLLSQAAFVPAQVPFQISAKPLRFQKCAGCAGVPA
jgi:hypothetical protein